MVWLVHRPRWARVLPASAWPPAPPAPRTETDATGQFHNYRHTRHCHTRFFGCGFSDARQLFGLATWSRCRKNCCEPLALRIFFNMLQLNGYSLILSPPRVGFPTVFRIFVQLCMQATLFSQIFAAGLLSLLHQLSGGKTEQIYLHLYHSSFNTCFCTLVKFSIKNDQCGGHC